MGKGDVGWLNARFVADQLADLFCYPVIQRVQQVHGPDLIAILVGRGDPAAEQIAAFAKGCGLAWHKVDSLHSRVDEGETLGLFSQRQPFNDGRFVLTDGDGAHYLECVGRFAEPDMGDRITIDVASPSNVKGRADLQAGRLDPDVVTFTWSQVQDVFAQFHLAVVTVGRGLVDLDSLYGERLPATRKRLILRH